MTNLRFVPWIEVTRGMRHPFSPSVDRIGSGKGYARKCSACLELIVNLALNDLSDDAFALACGRRRPGTCKRVSELPPAFVDAISRRAPALQHRRPE